MNVGNPSLSALVSWLNFKLCVFLNSNKMKHSIHFQCGRLYGRSTSGILHCICGLIKQNRKSLLRSFPAVYTISFAFCALERSLTNFFSSPQRHSTVAISIFFNPRNLISIFHPIDYTILLVLTLAVLSSQIFLKRYE